MNSLRKKIIRAKLLVSYNFIAKDGLDYFGNTECDVNIKNRDIKSFCKYESKQIANLIKEHTGTDKVVIIAITNLTKLF